MKRFNKISQLLLIILIFSVTCSGCGEYNEASKFDYEIHTGSLVAFGNGKITLLEFNKEYSLLDDNFETVCENVKKFLETEEYIYVIGRLPINASSMNEFDPKQPKQDYYAKVNHVTGECTWSFELDDFSDEAKECFEKVSQEEEYQYKPFSPLRNTRIMEE